MSQNVIFCYSGTGNCLDIATNVAKELGDTDIIMMRKAPAVTNVTSARRVGFIFPCYAGGLPGHVREYVSTIQVSPHAYTFAIVSYAGYPGTGLADINNIIPLDYSTGISHQSSCIWLMPHDMMFPRLSVEEAQNRSEELARAAASDILAAKRNTVPAANPLNKLEQAAWPKLAKKKSAQFTVSNACVMCGQCEAVCPMGNIKLAQALKRPNIGRNCIGCLSCLQYCPTQAISMGKLVDSRERYHNPKVSAEALTQAVIHID